jgi:hypothetical protein
MRAAGLGPAQMRMCAEGLAARFGIAAPKIVSWTPRFVIDDYRKAFGWPREGASPTALRGLYEDSLVIMVPKFEAGRFEGWYGTPLCFYVRDRGALRLLTACASGRLGACQVPYVFKKPPAS